MNFKDYIEKGDVVEVDANNGEIKVIEKTH